VSLKEAKKILAPLKEHPASSEWLSVPDAAARAKLAPATLWTWIRQGRLRVYGRSGGFRVRMADVLPEWEPSNPPRAD
jgi:hypothetical protein